MENFHIERLLLLFTHLICLGGTAVCTHRLKGLSLLLWFLLPVFSEGRLTEAIQKTTVVFLSPLPVSIKTVFHTGKEDIH